MGVVTITDMVDQHSWRKLSANFDRLLDALADMPAVLVNGARRPWPASSGDCVRVLFPVCRTKHGGIILHILHNVADCG
jgi:hypothetical protein